MAIVIANPAIRPFLFIVLSLPDRSVQSRAINRP